MFSQPFGQIELHKKPRSPLTPTLNEESKVQVDLHSISPLPSEAIEFINDLSQMEAVEKLIVFGSRACGDFDKYSDIDLAIIAPSFSRADWVFLRARAIHEVRIVFRISIVNFLSNPQRLQKKIYENGAVIYERS